MLSDRKPRTVRRWLMLLLPFVAGTIVAAQEPWVALPNNYKLQFENAWVRVVRVHYPGNVKLPSHDHAKATFAFVYLSDSGRVIFSHDPDHGPGRIIRPPVKARGYRVAVAQVGEAHTVENTTSVDSDYLRIEFKVASPSIIFHRILPPPLKTDTASAVEVTNELMQITRITIGAGKSLDLSTTTAEPALVIALTPAELSVRRSGAQAQPLSLELGQEHWMDIRTREAVTNRGSAAVELLKFDFLIAPPR